MSEVLSTTNYSIFKLFKSNRDTNVDLLIESIKERNSLHSHPILVTKEMYVVDGQHRLECAKRLNVPIYYIIDESASEDDIPLCQVQRGWRQDDFLKFYACRSKEYAIFLDISSKFQMPLNFMISCLSSGSARAKQFRAGKLKLLYSPEKCIEILEKTQEIVSLIKSICEKKVLRNNAYFAIFDIVRQDAYEHDHFIKKIKTHPDNVVESMMFFDEGNIRTKLLEKVYLFRMRKQ